MANLFLGGGGINGWLREVESMIDGSASARAAQQTAAKKQSNEADETPGALAKVQSRLPLIDPTNQVLRGLAALDLTRNIGAGRGVGF